MNFKKEEPLCLEKTEMRVHPLRSNPMQERLKDKIGEITSQDLERTKAQLELTRKLADAERKERNLLSSLVEQQEKDIEYLLQVLLDVGVELPSRVQELIADRIEGNFFGKSLNDGVESKHSMFSGVGQPLEEVVRRLKDLQDSALAVFSNEQRAKNRAGW